MTAITTEDYTYSQMPAHNLTASDLIAEYDAHDVATGGPVEIYCIRFYDADGYMRSAEALYLPSQGRLGIAWGAQATWATVDSLPSGIKMWATDGEAWEAAN